LSIESDLSMISNLLNDLGVILVSYPRSKIEILSEDNDNLKTSIDLFADRFIKEGLKKIKAIPIVSEEDANQFSTTRPDKYWIIDPIDGTRSMVDGFKTYVSQVALINNGIPILGIVHVPESRDVYHSIKGGGSYKNGKLLLKNLNQKANSIIDNYPSPIEYISSIMKSSGIEKYIECGSIGLKMCKVADGEADVFIKKTRVYDWDLAPAKLLIEEMGGEVKLIHGEEIKLYGSIRKENLLAAGNNEILRNIIKETSKKSIQLEI